MLATSIVFIGLLVAACGERPQVVDHKQGTYQGKADTPAYSAARFDGNREQWDDELRTRTQTQNEYRRMGG